MRNFSLKTKESSRRRFEDRPASVALLVTIGALVALAFLGVFLGQLVEIVTKPVYSISSYLRESNAALPAYVRGRTELLTEIVELKRKIATLNSAETTLARLLAENEELRSVLGTPPDKRIPASIIARPPLVPYDVLVIDRGRDAGIETGAAVYLLGDHAVGSVSAVYARSALVTLFSSPGVKSSVYVYGPNIFTSAYGEGGGVIRVSAPQGVPLEVGDTVVLPTLGAGALGIIEKVESTATEPEQRGFLTLPLPLQSLRVVAVDAHAAEQVSFTEASRVIEQFTNERFQLDIPREFDYTATGTPAEAASP